MTELDKVAKRLANEVGLSQTASRRVAKRLNELAKSVTWATPIELAPAGKNAPRKRSLTGSASRRANSATRKRRSARVGRLRRNAA